MISDRVLAVERMAQRSSLRNSTRDLWDQYNRLSVIHSYLDSTASANSAIALVETIGTSYQGNALKLIRIGVNVANKNKPVIFVDGGIHAREWVSPAFATCLIDYLVTQYNANDAQVVALLNKFDWVILPVVNPDGYEYSHTNVCSLKTF
jgi:murein tripeptide amidase MpaA